MNRCVNRDIGCEHELELGRGSFLHQGQTQSRLRVVGYLQAALEGGSLSREGAHILKSGGVRRM